ncbi:hypothetical protein FACS1894111_13480 [Clostridia bacterium]|nr:hypothetical protein FACS1894111_13480 [Clostridia bacterium]
MGRLIIEGNSVYEVDEECIRTKEQERKREQAIERRQAKTFPRRSNSNNQNRNQRMK